jgi:catechol 2,3-dioxygenase-like lactoylglutathione lyase family enzyme
MILGIAQTALIVRDYDEAIEFYCGKLGFQLLEDTDRGSKRWVRIQGAGGLGPELILSKATNPQQLASVGNQTGGRVLFFLTTDDFDSDYDRLCSLGVKFVEEPRDESYGKVAVFCDLYGSRIDLIQPR